MFTGEELYDIIVAANIELQNLLSLLLSIYAEEHALTNPPVAGKNALHTLLSTHIVPLKKTIKPYVCKKLFTSKKCDVILPLVDAKKLDSSLLFDIFLKVGDILSIAHSIGKCKHCIGACCNGCNHISPGCKNCTGNSCSPTKKRLHLCRDVSCEKKLQECKEKHKTICCTSCAACITCNKTRFENDAISVLSKSLTCRATCPWYTFIHSLEMTKCFRDLFGHVTVEECEEFTTNGVALNEEFKNCKKTEELEVYLQFLFEHIVDHAEAKLQDVTTRAMVPSASLAKLEELNNTKERLNKTMDNLKCIFEHGESLKKYFADNCSKMEEIFRIDLRFYKRMQLLVTQIDTSLARTQKQIIDSVGRSKDEVLTAIEDKQRQDDRRNKVKLVRRLNKGFVLKLPLAKDEDVKVKYKRASDGDENLKEADADQKRDGGTVYLRVERLPHTGVFQVCLALTSEGVFKQEISLSVKAIECQLPIADGYLRIVAPPNRSDEDICSNCARHLDQNKCVQETTTLAIAVVNDDAYNDGESTEKIDDESDDESAHEELNAGEFMEKGLCYLERNFVKFEDVITFPPLNMITDKLTRKIFDMFADLLKQESEPGLKLLLSNYDDSKFCQFIRVAEVKDLFDRAVPATNRLLLFYSRFATIVNARIVEEKVNIHQEMSNCINDLKLFSCTFKSVVNNKVIVTGLLVCPYLSRAEVEEEMDFYFNKGEKSKKLMKYFFLTKDELESKKDESDENKSKLTKWWVNDFQKKLLRIFNSIKNSVDGDILLNMFKRISGQCMATIACCDVQNKSMLPTTSDDAQTQILTLLLSNAQLNAIYAPEKKKLVFGAFGCGKSVIAESVVRNIYDEALSQDKKCLIMYAIQDDHSLLEVKNRRFVDGLKAEMKQRGTGDGSCSDDLVSIESGTFHSLAGQSADGSNSLLNFVKTIVIERNAFDSINLVIDEVDHNSIEGEDGIKEFKKLLNSIDRFVIFPRSANLQVQLPGEEMLQQESNLHRLGLKPYPLEVVMRNSVEIVNLAESSQKTVEKSRSIFQYPSTPSQVMDAPKPLQITDLSETSLSKNLRKRKIDKPQEEVDETIQLDNADISSTKHGKKKIKVNINLLNAAKHIDKQKPSSSKTLELGSKFIKCIPGHKVTKRKPNLINLPEAFDFHSDNGAKILSVVLDKVCLKDFDPLLKSHRGRYQSAIFDSPTIICNEVEEVNITYYALTLIPRLQDCCIVHAPDLRRKYFSWEDKEPIYDDVKTGNKILIADNCSMRGMESRHVITFINPLEKFHRYVLPEVVTRANVSLDIISFPVYETAQTGTLEDVVNNWLGQNNETEKLVEVTDVTVSLDSMNQDEICSKEKDHLIIHVQSREFDHYSDGHLTFEEFLAKKQEELSTEELKRTDIESAVSNHVTKLSLTEAEKHSSTNVASTSTSESTVAEQRFDDSSKHTFEELEGLLINKSTRDKFNTIITSEPSLTKLRSKYNYTLLHMAAEYGATECVEVLIKNGCDVKEKDVNGWMAIHRAARYNNTQVMKILLSHDPSMVNVTTNYNKTPLHIAADWNYREAVELLLSQPSVDVNARDVRGMTPDEYALVNDEIETMIRSHHNYSTSHT